MEEKYDNKGNLICPFTLEICLYFENLFPDEEPDFCVEKCGLYNGKGR